jgi:hypothetical protein
VPENKSSVNDEVKFIAGKSPEEAVEQSKVSGVKTKTRIEAGTSSRQPQNRIVQFPKPDHPVFVASS